MQIYDTVILGSGAAGLSAGVYAGRYKMKSLIIGKEFGGETATAGVIENWPGDISVDGYALMERMREHAKANGAELIDGEVTEVKKDGDCFIVKTTKSEFHAPTVIFALGSERRRLGLPNERELTGKGVHYCMTCDGPLYSGKEIAIVGGGDASAKSAILAADYMEKIYLLVRSDKMRAEPINQERLKTLGDKLEIVFETQVKEIIPGENGMFDKIKLTKAYHGSEELDVDGLFIDIGAVPNTDMAADLGVKLDNLKQIDVTPMMETNIEGVYAAGDIANLFGHFKQDITASAMGSVAATSAYEYFKQKGNTCSHAA